MKIPTYETLRLAIDTEESREGVHALTENRKPDFPKYAKQWLKIHRLRV